MTKTLERVTINSIEDFTRGAGKGVHIEIANMGDISMIVGADRFKRGDGLRYGSFKAMVTLIFHYEAGYAIEGLYQYQSKGNIPDVIDHDTRVAYAKNGAFNLVMDMEHGVGVDMPYDNWSCVVYEDEALLNDILALDPSDKERFVEPSCGQGIGKGILFMDVKASCQVSDHLRCLLDPNSKTALDSPFDTKALDNALREKLVDRLIDMNKKLFTE